VITSPFSSFAKACSVSAPPKLVKEAEKAAKEENRTKSELIREALR